MKRVLIISPYFPPSNAADMQRIRMSLPYFREMGWDAEIMVVDEVHSEMTKDPLLLLSIPNDTTLHKVGAFSKRWTGKLGLGSLALRSLWHYRKKGNALLRKKSFDLVYFSTTQFPVCILGKYWRKKFGVPYVIDMQDPWHTDYYQDKPKGQRPPKYWFSYRLNKLLEPVAMKRVSGLIAVSEDYLFALSRRYSNCSTVPRQTITFGAFEKDFEIARMYRQQQPSILPKQTGKINIVYIGRGGADMQEATSLLFKAFKKGLQLLDTEFARIHFYFIGTSYAAAGKGIATISPIAEAHDVSAYVTEITDRIPFYQTLNTLADADALFIPGSNDIQYTASKIYPYVMAQKPMLALFHKQSSVVAFLKECKVGTVATFDQQPKSIEREINQFMLRLTHGDVFSTMPDPVAFGQYTAEKMTEKQCAVFNAVVQ